MKKFLSAISLCIAALVVQPLAHGQKAESAAQASERRALIASLAKGQSFTRDGTTYQLLPEARAIRVKGKETPEQVLPRVGAKAGDLIERKSTLLVFRRTTKPVSPARTEIVNQQKLFPVALNPATGLLVALPGSIILTPKDMNSAGQIASTHGLRLARTFPHLGIAILEVTTGQDVLAAVQALSDDGRVSRAEPEVIAAFFEPR